MPAQEKIQEPIFVQNPITGRQVNVAPLFNAMQDFSDDSSGSPAHLKHSVTRAIRFVNLSAGDNEEAGRRNVSFDLYRLEDMFSAMNEYNQ